MGSRFSHRPDALPAADDVRRNGPWQDFFDSGGAVERHLERIAAVRDELTAGGRKLVPGFRAVVQVRENAAAGHGPLPAERQERIQAILGEPLQV